MLRGVVVELAPGVGDTWKAFPAIADDERPAAARVFGRWVETYRTITS